MWPKDDNVWKFAVLSALDCHGEMTWLPPESQARTVARGFPNELGDLHGGEGHLPMRST